MRLRRLAPLTALVAAAPVPPPPVLVPPIACALGTDCAIQSYPDDDPGPAATDYQCHGRTYPRHDGTDFRIPSMARQRTGVSVLAAAGGRVLRTRDGVADVSIRDLPAGATTNAECGNGLVIDHGGGWETQYCHMARGSLIVRPGMTVTQGQVLGRVGLSGNTEFPHVHLTVRHDGQAVDPFAWGAAVGQCKAGRSLWRVTPAYIRGQVLVAGFASQPPTMAQVQQDGAEQQPRPGRATALIAFVQSIGLVGGDVQRLTLRGPDGQVLADRTEPALDRDKAQTLLFIGRKAPTAGWPAGGYRLDYVVTRGEARVITAQRLVTF